MHPILNPQEVKAYYPLSLDDELWISSARHSAKEILSGRDSRKVLVVGPCSIHDPAATLEYAERFRALSERVKESCFLVMRVYLEKSRTRTGWKGLVYDPFLDGSDEMQTGLLWARELLTTLTKMRIPIATEFVDPLLAVYLEDLITWGFVGARTSSSQPHRQLASGLQYPIGFKNSVGGNLHDAIDGVMATRSPHTFLHMNEKGMLIQKKTKGNPYAHIVLRGSREGINYDPDSVREALDLLAEANLPLRLMIDCAHGNSQKQHMKQCDAFHDILEQITNGNHHIFGLMLESHLREGNQALSEDPNALEYAVSITDPCINWAMTEELIYKADALLSS